MLTYKQLIEYRAGTDTLTVLELLRDQVSHIEDFNLFYPDNAPLERCENRWEHICRMADDLDTELARLMTDVRDAIKELEEEAKK